MLLTLGIESAKVCSRLVVKCVMKRIGLMQTMIMAMNDGIRIVRKIVGDKLISKYKLAQEMKVTTTAVDDWVLGKYFNEDKHLKRLVEVRAEYLEKLRLKSWIQ